MNFFNSPKTLSISRRTKLTSYFNGTIFLRSCDYDKKSVEIFMPILYCLRQYAELYQIFIIPGNIFQTLQSPFLLRDMFNETLVAIKI